MNATNNKQSNSLLAKCMATENIRIEHQANAETASFDIKNRVLVLPVWQDMTDSMYDMLIGHEVSHALHTPFEGFNEWVMKMGSKHANLRKNFVNVTEDARIERLIKERFPGIRRDFASAYSEFAERDIFEIKNKNLSECGLIDRLNLESKLGLYGYANVPFSADEQVWVERMASTKTIEDAYALADDLYDLWLKNNPQVDDDNQDESGEPESGEDDGEEDGESVAGGDGEEDGEDDGESSDGESSDDDGEDDGESSDGDSDSDGDAESSDSGGESSDGADDDGGNESSDSDMGGEEDNGNQTSDVDETGYTQDAFDNAMQDLRDKSGNDYHYHTIPEVLLENVIVDYKTINEKWQKYHKTHELNDRYINIKNESVDACTSFLTKNKSTVNYMAQQFRMKQAANQDARTQINKSGVLDTTSMINYRWTEDIFVKNEVVADGKSHGLVLFVDWSGSMDSILQPTVEQLMILTEFCNKVDIPYEVYAFSSRNANSENKPLQNPYQEGSHVLRLNNFTLLNLLSSRMTRREYREACLNVYQVTMNDCRSRYPSFMQLGCTPLNEAIIASMQIVPMFQQNNNLQVVNAVFLSDGKGHGLGAKSYTKDDVDIVHDPVNHKEFTLAVNEEETATYLAALKARTGCTVIGIRLHNQPNVKNFRYQYFDSDENLNAAAAQYKKEKFIEVNAAGHDGYFIVRGKMKVVEDAMDSLSDDASYARIKNAFMKSATNDKTSRVLAGKIIDLVVA